MYATLVALAFSAYLYYQNISLDPQTTLIIGATGAALLFALTVILGSQTFSPMQREEHNSTPRAMDLDPTIKFLFILLSILPIVYLATSLLPNALLPLIVLFGVGIDAISHLVRRIMDYLNPFRIIDLLKKEAKRAINQDKDAQLIEMIEAISEVGLNSIKKHHTSTTNRAIDALTYIGDVFLSSAKSIAHPTQNPELKEKGVQDTISYVTLFLLQNLEEIHNQAIDKKLELTAAYTITALTKIATAATSIDLTLTSLPLYYINKLALKDLQNCYVDIGLKANISLLQVAKAISQSKNIAFQDLKPPFFSIISTLREITQETFRKDKNTKMAVLTQPFKELLQLTQEEPLKSHPDTPDIVVQIQRVLDEYAALAAVLATMPPMPNLNVDEQNPA